MKINEVINDEVINDEKIKYVEEFEAFVAKIEKALNQYYGDTASVHTGKYKKNNGIELTGVSVRFYGDNIAPTIYIEDCYRKYKAGETLGAIVRGIIEIIEQNKMPTSQGIIDFGNYELMKKRIAYKLVNTELNAKLLEEIPHIEYLDMSIVFMVVLEADDPIWGDDVNDRGGYILIYNNHLEMWGVDVQCIYEEAVENARRIFPAQIMMMKEMIDLSTNREFLPMECAMDIPDSIYVVTNSKHTYGASALVDENLWQEFSIKTQHNLFIIPSSIHEIIVIEDSGELNAMDLKNTISIVNSSCLEAVEVLSDNLYYYNQSTGKVTIM